MSEYFSNDDGNFSQVFGQTQTYFEDHPEFQAFVTENQESVDDVGFKCDICAKTFKQKQHRNRHMRTAHTGPSYEKGFKCTLCPKSFKDQRSLHRHEKEDHGKEKEGILLSLVIFKRSVIISVLVNDFLFPSLF